MSYKRGRDFFNSMFDEDNDFRAGPHAYMTALIWNGKLNNVSPFNDPKSTFLENKYLSKK